MAMEMLIDSADLELGTPVLQESELQGSLEIPVTAPTMLDRMRGAFSGLVEQIADVLPTPSRRLRAGMTAGTLALSGGALLAPAAEAKIVVGRGIAGVTIGQTEAQVTSELGAPGTEQPADSQGITTWNYSEQPLMGTVSFAGGKVDGIVTYSMHQKTNKGVGVGSSLAKVRKAYPKIKCSTGPFGPESAVCTVKSRVGGKVVETSFPFFSRSAGAREVDVNLK